MVALASPAAAAAEERAQLKEDLTENSPAPTRFTIKQLPASEGFTAKGTNVRVANVLFVEGSCVLGMGDAPVSASTQAHRSSPEHSRSTAYRTQQASADRR